MRFKYRLFIQQIDYLLRVNQNSSPSDIYISLDWTNGIWLLNYLLRIYQVIKCLIQFLSVTYFSKKMSNTWLTSSPKCLKSNYSIMYIFFGDKLELKILKWSKHNKNFNEILTRVMQISAAIGNDENFQYAAFSPQIHYLRCRPPISQLSDLSKYISVSYSK